MKVKIGDTTIFFEKNVLRILDQFKQDKKHKKEAGGILLGNISKSDKLNIIKASIPNKFDKASRHNFERNKDAAQVIIDFEFMNSEGKMVYLGEWHTHPEDYPSPSHQDYKMIKEQYNKNKLNTDQVVLIIKGLKGLYIGLFNGEDMNVEELSQGNEVIGSKV